MHERGRQHPILLGSGLAAEKYGEGELGPR